MVGRVFKWCIEHIFISISGAVGLCIVTWIAARLGKFDLVALATSAYASVASFLAGSHSIYNVLALIIYSFAFIGFVIFLKKLLPISKHVDYRDYCVDVIDEILWRWEWVPYGNDGITLHPPQCPKCKFELTLPDYYSSVYEKKRNFYCPECSTYTPCRDGGYHDHIEYLKKQIKQAVATEKYKERLIPM